MATDMRKNWEFWITSNEEILLFEIGTFPLLIENLACTDLTGKILFRLPGGFTAWQKLMQWVDTKRTELHRIPVTREDMVKIDPDFL